MKKLGYDAPDGEMKTIERELWCSKRQLIAAFGSSFEKDQNKFIVTLPQTIKRQCGTEQVFNKLRARMLNIPIKAEISGPMGAEPTKITCWKVMLPARTAKTEQASMDFLQIRVDNRAKRNLARR